MSHNKIDAYYGLPTEVKYCAQCVISNQRPNSTVEFRNAGQGKSTIGFDELGVCNACRYAAMKESDIDWKQREAELHELCDSFRDSTGCYDCIVPGSGGKDSVFTAHILKHKFGMNPLTVTWAPHIYTEVGFRNFQKWIHAGFDNVLVTPNGKVHRLLTKLAFENLLHPFQPFIVGQRHIAPKFSTQYGIPLVFYGENQAEYGHSIEENFKPTMARQFYQFDGDVDALSLGGASIKRLVDEHALSLADLQPYLPAESSRIQATGTVVHYLGYYLRWDPQECYYYAVEHTGFSANDERTEGTYSKYSSIDDRIDPLHYFTSYVKFGLGRASYDAAQEIRNGKITREEGVALVRRFDHEVPLRYLKQILEYIGISEDRFWELIDNGRSPHLWHKVNGDWRLHQPVWEESATPTV